MVGTSVMKELSTEKNLFYTYLLQLGDVKSLTVRKATKQI